MTLNFGLLKPSEISVKERWQQEGSGLVNASVGGDIDFIVYTVTTGKQLFVTQIIISYREGGAANDVSLIRDASGGDTKLTVNARNVAEGTTLTFNFTTPLKFLTNVFYDEVGTIAADVTITGWEEAA